MNVSDAAAVLGLPERSVYKAIRRGELPGIRIGRRVLVPVTSLHELLGEYDVERARTAAR
jgi:excisionase family DNA binding protein